MKMTITLKKILLLLALCISINGLTQENRQTKKITISLNDTITFVKEFNQNDSLIFIKDIQFWKDKSEHLFIDGFVFEDDRVVYEYHASEDFLRMIRYEYDSVTGLKDQFVKHTDEKPINNERLHSINNRDELIDLVESAIPKDSKLTNILHANEHHTLVKKGRSEIYTRFEDNAESVRVTKKYDKQRNLIFIEHRNQWQTTTTHFKYNRNNQLIREIFGFDDYKSTTRYYYENNQLTQSIYKRKNGSVSSTDYFYNEGFLVKEVVNRPEGLRIYTYEYD